MKTRIIAEHIPSGRKWVGVWMPTATKEECLNLVKQVKELNYLRMNLNSVETIVLPPGILQESVFTVESYGSTS